MPTTTTNFAKPTTFKFRMVNAGGQPTGIFASAGAVEEAGLLLGESRVPWENVLDSTSRDGRLILALDPLTHLDQKQAKNVLEGGVIGLQLTTNNATGVERAIDRHASRAEARRVQRRLESEGKGGEFRTAVCPTCEATVNLSELPSSRYVYCRFCEGLFSATSRTSLTTSEQRVCGECGMFDRVRGYTEFYFYFLVVLYGFSYKRRHLCDACAGSLFWKVLALNSIFVLGVPSAFWLKFKSMTGKDPRMKPLSDANRSAKKGKLDGAKEGYAAVLREIPEHPGILLNQAKAHFNAGDVDGGMKLIEKTLGACANYGPAFQTIVDLKGQLPAG